MEIFNFLEGCSEKRKNNVDDEILLLLRVEGVEFLVSATLAQEEHGVYQEFFQLGTFWSIGKGFFLAVAEINQGSDAVGDKFLQLNIDMGVLGLIGIRVIQEVGENFIQDCENLLLQGVESIIYFSESSCWDKAGLSLFWHILKDKSDDANKDLGERLVGKE